MRSFRSKPMGWRNDSHKHYLASKGIKTKFYLSDKSKQDLINESRATVLLDKDATELLPQEKIDEVAENREDEVLMGEWNSGFGRDVANEERLRDEERHKTYVEPEKLLSHLDTNYSNADVVSKGQVTKLIEDEVLHTPEDVDLAIKARTTQRAPFIPVLNSLHTEREKIRDLEKEWSDLGPYADLGVHKGRQDVLMHEIETSRRHVRDLDKTLDNLKSRSGEDVS